MDKQFSQDTSHRPRVVIFSGYNPLALSVAEMLLQKQCEVLVVGKEAELWRKNTTHIDSPIFRTAGTPEGISRSPNYIVFFGPTREREEAAFLNMATGVSKAFLIVSAEGRPVRKNSSTNTIFVRDLYGPRMEFGKTRLSLIVAQAIGGGVVQVPQGTVFYPTYLADVAKEIVGMLLSFGPPSEEVIILGEELRPDKVAEILTGYGAKTVFSGSTKDEGLPSLPILRTKTRFREGLKETLEWGRRQGVSLAKAEKPKAPRRSGKSGKTLAFLALSLFFIPFLLLAVSTVALLVGKNFLLKANTQALKSAGYLAKGTSRGASSALRIYSLVPVAGELFIPFYRASRLVERVSEVVLKGVFVVEEAGALGEKVLGDQVYDPVSLSREIYLTLDGLYQELGFLEGEVKEQKGVVGYGIGRILKDSDLADLRTKTLQLKSVFAVAPELLGKDGPATYLLLFQNNMELRPTGGFIGSLAIVTFDGGRLSDINVQDVYSLDGQLKGHVEPPEPIRDHLGEANWFLRDSNWDPDFPTSASRAEWFLGKETGRAVDGTIALDLEVAKSLLRITGPIVLADFGKTINADNLYEITQSEVEESFFPGSHKKANFLTALARQLVQEVLEIPPQRNASLAKALVENLEGRNIQIFLHQKEAQRAISGMGYDGSFQIPSCPGNCYADFLGIVEANVGVNKANYFIKRQMKLETSFEGGTVQRRLSITFENSASPSLGTPGRYKVYLRIFVPLGSEVGETPFDQGQEAAGLTPDIKDAAGKREIGLLAEVLPGQTKTLSFSWSGEPPLSFGQKGEYRFYWRKQAGTGSDPAELSIVAPKEVAAKPLGAALTRGGAFVYNTNLARDLFSRISW